MNKLLDKLNKNRALTDKSTTGVDKTNQNYRGRLKEVVSDSQKIWNQGKGGSGKD